MKRIVLLICIGSLTLGLTARAEEQNNPPQKKGGPKAQPPQRPAALGGRGGLSNVRQMGPSTSTAMVNRSIAASTAARGQTRVTVTNSWTGPTFSGRNYAVFRNYQPGWHDSAWWRHHHDRIIFVSVFAQPFPFFFDAGYWYPCWGYYPGAYYPYDGPIYGYNDLPPDQVITNVQIQLQSAGYYAGPIDGVLGPLTRASIADYQRDHGLAITAAIDEPTVVSLGLV